MDVESTACTLHMDQVQLLIRRVEENVQFPIARCLCSGMRSQKWNSGAAGARIVNVFICCVLAGSAMQGAQRSHHKVARVQKYA